MKKYFLFFPFYFTIVLNAQVLNINPDPNGDPWRAGGLPKNTSELQDIIDDYPYLTLSQESENTALPDSVDNSKSKYFRPIFHQVHSSCGQAAGIGYVYTYEINRLRNLTSDTTLTENLYPTHFTYNFLNDGYYDFPSHYYEGWEILKNQGCPNIANYGGLVLMGGPDGAKSWISGYNIYKNSLYNRVDSIFNINASDSAGLVLIKHWLNDHNEGDSVGGLVCFSTLIKGVVYDSLPEESSHSGEQVMTTAGTNGQHAMTVVGYNDHIKYHLNDDSVFTSDEIGAFKVANSSDVVYGNKGFIWVPYSFLFNDTDSVYHFQVVKVKEYIPKMAIKVKIKHPERSRIEYRIDYKELASDTTTPLNMDDYPVFSKQGGRHPMQGVNEDPIEIMLDYGHFYMNDTNYVNNRIGKYFISIFELDNQDDSLTGYVYALALVDYRWDETFELEWYGDSIELVNASFTNFSFEYDLLPHDRENKEIDADLTLGSNMVSRFTTEVTDNATLTVGEEVRIDMYDSEIHIDQGSALVINEGVTFHAKSGNCQIIVDGILSLDTNVHFVAEDSAMLTIRLNNTSLDAEFEKVYFENCHLICYTQDLTITDCEFSDCDYMNSFRGNVNISNTPFTNTSVYLGDQTGGSTHLAQVTGCAFYQEYHINPPTVDAIEIYNYSNYNLENNEIDGFYCGVVISQSGGGSGMNSITQNEIHDISTTGIVVFNSAASIHINHVYHCESGIRLNNNTNVSINGIPSAESFEDMNYVVDNTGFELYCSTGSFPWYFRYNAIIDEDNGSSGDYLIYAEHPGGSVVFNAEYNCFGDYFDEQEDLYPYQYLDAHPTFCPAGGEHKSVEAAFDDFQQGTEYFENEEFDDAKEMFESIVENYPQTVYAGASMKYLFDLEKYLNSDFSALQTYYETDGTIQGDSILSKLANFLSNKCEIEMENWQTAIDHYEQIILEPNCPQDSIFAIIDLGYTYFLMDNSSSRSTAMGRMPEHRPGSLSEFNKKRDYLLNLLPFKNSTETGSPDGAIVTGVAILKQNSPNPFRGTTTIGYELDRQSHVVFEVYDGKGMLVRSVDLSTQEAGLNHLQLDMQNWPEGMYFYSISINGLLNGSKKMIVK